MRACVFSFVTICATLAGGAAQAVELLVVGAYSNNVVRFDIDSGAAGLWGNYLPDGHSFPRELAMDEQGRVYGSTALMNRNIVKFVPQDGTDVMQAVDFTGTIGSFGPGELQFYQGDLYAAGDQWRQIVRFDGETGAQIEMFGVTSAANIRSMVIDGDNLYYAEIFQNRVRKMDLTQSPPTGGTFFTNATALDEPVAMAIGAGGNLFITSRDNTLVQEFDITTGLFVGTLVDLNLLNPAFTEGQCDVIYDAALNNYFVSAGNKVFRLSVSGELLQTYESELLMGAYGLLIVPEPSSWALLAIGVAWAIAQYCSRTKLRPASVARSS